MIKRVLITVLSLLLVFSMIPSALAEGVQQDAPASSEEPIVSAEPSEVPEPSAEPTTAPSEEPAETPQPTTVPTEEPAETPQPTTVPAGEQAETPQSEVTVTALMYTIGATSSNTDYGTVTGGGRYISGSTVTLTATPKPGGRFLGWWRGATFVIDTATYSFAAINNNAYSARFEAIGKPVITSIYCPTYNTVTLTWSNVSGAKYEVLRAKSSTGTYIGIATTNINVTTYTDTVPESGKTYYYKVRAYYTTTPTDITTYGSKSSYRSAKPDWAKLNLTAATENYYSIRLSWNPIPNADHYDVYRNTRYYGTYTRIADDVAGTSYIDDKDGAGLTTGKRYYYKIKPVDEITGGEVVGPYCSYKSAKPAWPKINLTASTQNYQSIYLSWNPINGADRYDVYRSTHSDYGYDKIGFNSVNTNYLDNDPELELNHRYYYKIKPVDQTPGGDVEGPFCSYKSAKPAWPNINLTASAKNLHSIELCWNWTDGANYYNIYRSTHSGSGYTWIDTVGDDLAEPKAIYVDNGTDIAGGLVTGKTYYYKVQSFYSWAGDETYGTCFYASAKPGWAKISLTAKSNDFRSIKLEWNKVDGATCYYVYRSTHSSYGYSKNGNAYPGAAPTITYIDNNLTMGRRYYYKIKPVDETIPGNPIIGPYCSYKSARPVPIAPYDLGMTRPGTPGSFFVSWEMSPGASGYQLYRATSELGTYVKIRTITQDSFSGFSDEGLTLGQTYWYKVRAYYYIGSTKYYTAYDTASDTM